MATEFEVLEVKDKHKVNRLNINFSYVPRYLGELASAPATTGVCQGSTYYNTGDSYLYFLKEDGTTWTKVSP